MKKVESSYNSTAADIIRIHISECKINAKIILASVQVRSYSENTGHLDGILNHTHVFFCVCISVCL